MRVLEAFDLYRFYHADDDETLALRGVSLFLEQAEIVALMGPSGSGKSTLIACLAGLDEPDGGRVIVMGRPMTRRPDGEQAALRAANIGFLAQSGNLFDHLTVEENVWLQRRLAGKQGGGGVQELLGRVGLAERRHSRPPELSGGEAGRAGLAVALAADPPILLADEPTGEVDPYTESLILDILEARRDAGGAALIATHSEAVAGRADRVIQLRDGRAGDATDHRA